MKIGFNQLDNTKKSVQFLEGIFPLETDKKFFWVWTSTKISGVTSNVKYLTIEAFSEIDNVLISNGYEMEIKSDCLNIIKLNTTENQNFTFELLDAFKPVNDDRDLGIRIVRILIDGEVIF